MSDNVSQERISQKLSPESEPSGKKGILIAVICVILVLAVVVVMVLVFLKPKDANTRNVVITPDNIDEVLAEMGDQKAETGTYEVVMNSTWSFKNGHSASTNAYVENSTSNQNDVYFDVVRDDTGESIFKSPTIPVGSHLENITLDSDLPAGDYACTLTYHLLDDSGEPTSKLSLALDISVEK
jgi:hypothetical protein